MTVDQIVARLALGESVTLRQFGRIERRLHKITLEADRVRSVLDGAYVACGAHPRSERCAGCIARAGMRPDPKKVHGAD